MSEHVEKHASGVSMCKHCGGEVGDDGYSLGGIVDLEAPVPADQETEQMEGAERLSDAAFADAIKGRGGR